MLKVKTLVLVVSCAATEERRLACQETWLGHPHPAPGRGSLQSQFIRHQEELDMAALFVVGTPGVRSRLSGDILYCNCSDSYVGLPEKTWAMVQEALMRFEFDWLFKCDDDTLCQLSRLAHYPKSRDYMGRKAALCGDDPDWHKTEVVPKEKTGTITNYELEMLAKQSQYIGPWANGGSGYFLSRHAAGLVAQEPYSHIKKELYEDKMVGDIMISHGIYLHGAHSTLRHNIDPGSWNHLVGATTLHPLTPEKMRKVYHRLLRAGEMET